MNKKFAYEELKKRVDAINLAAKDIRKFALTNNLQVGIARSLPHDWECINPSTNLPDSENADDWDDTTGYEYAEDYWISSSVCY